MSEKELEIKFTGAPSALSALPGSPFMDALTRGEGAWERLETRYYDTPEGDLAASGVSLRLREAGGGLVQTVKRKGAAGVVDREEWERPLNNGEAFPALTGASDIDVALSTLADRLRPELRIDVDRWACAFPFRNSRLEIAVDLGVSQAAAEGSRPPAMVGEVELELITGSAEDLFAAAKLLLVNAPLRLSARSKLETAKAAAAGTEAEIPSRRKIDASAGETAGVLLQRALVAAAERMIDIQPAITQARAVEGVHQMRVELRRFRAIERVFRRSLGDETLSRLAGRAKIFARALGPARDWDVFLAETLSAAASHDYAPEGFAALKAKAHGLRAEAWGRAAAIIDGLSFSTFLLELLEAAHAATWARPEENEALAAPVERYARKALDRTWRKTRKTAFEMDRDNLAARHPLRIALKKQRYAVQIFRALYPKDSRKPYMAAMSALQEAFGAVNDAVVAQGLANEAAMGGGERAMRAAGFICGFHAARAEAAAKEIDAAWAAFEEMTPFWRAEDE